MLIINGTKKNRPRTAEISSVIFLIVKTEKSRPKIIKKSRKYMKGKPRKRKTDIKELYPISLAP